MAFVFLVYVVYNSSIFILALKTIFSDFVALFGFNFRLPLRLPVLKRRLVAIE